VLHDFNVAAILFDLEHLASRTVHSGAISAREAVCWLRSLQDAAAHATFSAHLSGAIVVGITPLQ
jgi:hypothetical protein